MAGTDEDEAFVCKRGVCAISILAFMEDDTPVEVRFLIISCASHYVCFCRITYFVLDYEHSSSLYLQYLFVMCGNDILRLNGTR